MAKPIPAVPPVITAIFPCNLLMSVIRPLPGPLGSFPVICSVAADDMSDSRERKMKAHHHEPISRNAVQNGLARLDRLRGLVVEDRRPVGMLEARHRVMGDVAHMHELLLARGEFPVLSELRFCVTSRPELLGSLPFACVFRVEVLGRKSADALSKHRRRLVQRPRFDLGNKR